MTSALLKIFVDLANKGLKENDLTLSKVILNLYDFIKDADFLNKETQLLNNAIFKDWDEPINEDTIRGKIKEISKGLSAFNKHYDNRIKSVTLENFRTFPKSRPPYGLNFKSYGEPCSIFLVGANGTGKTTIFDALEYYYTGHVSIASSMPIASKDYYFNFAFKSNNKPKVYVNTIDYLNFNELGSKALTFFISDNDLNNVDQFKDNISDFVLEQLGYSEINNIEDSLSALSEYIDSDILNLLRFPIDNPKIMKRIINMVLNNPHRDIMQEESKKYLNEDAILDAINAEDTSYTYFKAIWKSIIKTKNEKESSSIIGAVEQQINKDSKRDRFLTKIHTLASYYKVLNDYLKSQEENREKFKMDMDVNLNILKQYNDDDNLKIKRNVLDQHKQLLAKVQESFQNIRLSLLKTFSESSKDFVETTMNNISISEKDVFHLNNDDNGNVFVTIENKEKGINGINPMIYLNTFRFRMYEICLKIALAFLQMKRLDRALPIVMDDIFNSNDFANGLSLRNFVSRIYRTYRKQVNFKESLQIILLTHDELIQSEFKKGAIQAANVFNIDNILMSKDMNMFEENTDYIPNVICGRLFPYYVIEQNNRERECHNSFMNLYIPN